MSFKEKDYRLLKNCLSVNDLGDSELSGSGVDSNIAQMVERTVRKGRSFSFLTLYFLSLSRLSDCVDIVSFW